MIEGAATVVSSIVHKCLFTYAHPKSEALLFPASLNLPANYSIGVYKADYRGFAKLAARQDINSTFNIFGAHKTMNTGAFISAE
jgi:hypothetical protein